MWYSGKVRTYRDSILDLPLSSFGVLNINGCCLEQEKKNTIEKDDEFIDLNEIEKFVEKDEQGKFRDDCSEIYENLESERDNKEDKSEDTNKPKNQDIKNENDITLGSPIPISPNSISRKY